MNQIGSSRVDTILKMLLILFISTLAFTTGVYIGRETVKSDMELKALEGDFQKTQSMAKDDHGKDNPEAAITEEEVSDLSNKLMNSDKVVKNDADSDDADAAHGAKNPEESRKVASSDEEKDQHSAAPKADEHAAPADKHAPAAAAAHGDAKPGAHGKLPEKVVAKPAEAAHHPAPAAEHEAEEAAHPAPAAHAPQAAAHTTKPDLSAAAKAAQRVANNAAPVEKEKAEAKSRVPTSLPKAVGSSSNVEYTVQIASYPSFESAHDHADELNKTKGLPTFQSQATVNGKTWYRVSVGAFKNLKDATTYRSQLMKDMAVPNAIVQRIER